MPLIEIYVGNDDIRHAEQLATLMRGDQLGHPHTPNNIISAAARIGLSEMRDVWQRDLQRREQRG